MGKLTAYILRSFRAWDRPTQIAMLTAVFLFFPTIIVLIVGLPQLRQPALIGFIGLIIATQIIFMWGNRTMVIPYTQAQRHYLKGEFELARQVLENLLSTEKVDVRSLTLLGNTYRQLALLDESQEVLTKALDLRPFDHFPLYGIGRTLLVKGLFAQAAAKIKQALDAGAPTIVQFDLAEALYRQGANDDARLALRAAQEIADEPHQALMGAYLLYRLGEGERPANDLIIAGLPYWRDSAHRFQMTPYGQMLADDIQHLQAFMEEE